MFGIVSDTGQLTLKAATNFNHEIRDTYTVTVEVHDRENVSIRGHATVTVLVTLIDDAVEQPDAYSSHSLTVDYVSRTEITVTWNNDEYESQFAPEDRASLLLSYESGGGSPQTTELASNVTVHSIEGLSTNSAYTLSLRWKSSGTGVYWSGSVEATTKVNRAPVFDGGSSVGRSPC